MQIAGWRRCITEGILDAAERPGDEHDTKMEATLTPARASDLFADAGTNTVETHTVGLRFVQSLR